MNRTTTTLRLAVAAALAVTLAACSTAEQSEPEQVTTTTAQSPTTTVASTTSTVEEAPSVFPVTVPHAFGETTIESEPTRVVAWGWATADALIALDVIPVAIPFQGYGADAEGVLPWIRDTLEGAGHDVPTVLPNTAEPPFEAIAAVEPDLILAPYSGITEQDYALLSEIAPTVAYPEQAWATPWRETIEIVGTAVGRAEQAAQLLDEIDTTVAAAATANPELSGKSLAVVWPTADVFYVYKPADARVQFIEDLGFVTADSVNTLGEGGETFYFTLSFEQLDQLTSDVLVVYADGEEGIQQFLDSDAAQLMSQVQAGTVAAVVGQEFIASVSPPTALSLTWGLDSYVEILSGAAQAVDQG